jgi:DNA-binding transcriptional LysR family regulator
MSESSAYAGNMDFDRLRAFVWILEEGGISPAARRLCRTQPAVTRMLQTLEEQVGAVLIDRRARPMKPTAAGERVLKHAREILLAAERLTDGSIPGTRQLLRLGLSRSLMQHLSDTRFINPGPPLSDTDFIVRSGWSPRLYRRFVRGEFDCAVVLMPVDWAPDIPCRIDVARKEPLVLIAPRLPGAAAKVRASFNSLRDREWILNPDGCGFRGALLRGFAEVGHRPRVQFELDASPQEHLAMVAAGIGCSIVPASALKQSARDSRRIQQIEVSDFRCELAVTLLWAERAKPAAGTEAALARMFGQAQAVTSLRSAASPLRYKAV